jgi:hypothetical protein
MAIDIAEEFQSNIGRLKLVTGEDIVYQSQGGKLSYAEGPNPIVQVSGNAGETWAIRWTGGCAGMRIVDAAGGAIPAYCSSIKLLWRRGATILKEVQLITPSVLNDYGGMTVVYPCTISNHGDWDADVEVELQVVFGGSGVLKCTPTRRVWY